MGVLQAVNDLGAELETELDESQNCRDKRVEELWRKLDPDGHGELDLQGLQKGLRRLDHPLKNADDMLEGIMQKLDTNKDGKIQFAEFRDFVEATEHKLSLLFKSINRHHDGRLVKSELSEAFQKAGITIPQRRLGAFFDEIDENHDGYITFEEWRNFLLFMPVDGKGSPLEAALSFYSSIVSLNAEGDSMVTEETLEGLGTTAFLMHALFGSILQLAQLGPDPRDTVSSAATSPPEPPPPLPTVITPKRAQQRSNSATSASDPSDETVLPPDAASEESMALRQATDEALCSLLIALEDELESSPDIHDHPLHLFLETDSTVANEDNDDTGWRLTDYLPESGYFVAGALAGGISRTATAPLDRLKVFLIVNTGARTNDAVEAVKSGQPIKAAQKAVHPISAAVRDLWRAGGVKTFFAGNGLNVIKIMPETAIKFGSYEAAKRALAKLEGHGNVAEINPWSKYLAGGLAGMTAQFCVYPLDTLKFRMQSETVKGGLTGNALIIQTARKMAAEGAVKSSYRGVTMGLIGMFPYSAIDMGTFEVLKTSFIKYKAKYYNIHEEDALPGNLATGIIGATSGAFGATVVYPLNVLRTRLQTQGTAMHPPTYTGIVDVAQKTWRNEGFKGMYKGLTPNLLKVAPALSITWVVYENMKKLLDLH